MEGIKGSAWKAIAHYNIVLLGISYYKQCFDILLLFNIINHILFL